MCLCCVYAGRSENKIDQKLFALHLGAHHDAKEIKVSPQFGLAK